MTTPPRRYTAPEGIAVVLPAEPTWLSPELAHLPTKLSREAFHCGASPGACAASSSVAAARG